MVRPLEEAEMLLIKEFRSQQIFLSPELDAKEQMRVYGLVGLCIPQSHSDEVKNPPINIKALLNYCAIFRFRRTKQEIYSSCKYQLTSSDVRQNQQNTCLQRLHIIWAQPASRSIGT